MRRITEIIILTIAISVMVHASACADVKAGAGIVRVEGLHLMDEDEFLFLMGIHDAEVTPDTITAGIKRVFKKGLFDDIVVYREDEGLRITVKERRFIRSIDVTGNDALSDKEIINTLPFKEGDVLRYEMIGRARDAVLDYYRLRGYPEARVLIDVNERPRSPYIDLSINISEGRPQVIESIVIEGYPQWIKADLGFSRGDVYDQILIQEELKRLQGHFRKKGYEFATVGPYTYEQGVLTISIKAGKRLVVRFEGNSRISDDDLADVIDFSQSKGVEEEVVDENASRILKEYHKRGYPNAQVAPVIADTDDSKEVVFFIHEGDRYRVGEVKIRSTTQAVGEEIIERLKRIMENREGELFNPDNTVSDEERLKDFLSALGYRDAKVVEREISYNKQDKKISLHLGIDPGERYTIGELRLIGNTVIKDEELRKILSLRQGAPFNPADLYEARRRVINRYREQGYLDAKLMIRTEHEGKSVHIILTVDEGNPSYIGKTIIRGNLDTNARVILRELNYKEGDRADYRLFPILSKRLYQTGLFERVNIRLGDNQGGKRDVIIDLKERKPGIFEFGFGYGEYEKMRGFVSLSYRNLWGMNRRVTTLLRLSKLRQLLSVNYNEPYLFGKRIRLNTLLLGSYKKEISIDTGKTRYKVRRYSAELSLSREISSHLKGELTYSFSLVDTFDVSRGVVLSKEDRGTLAISAIKPALLYDTRDNLFEPHKGILVGVSLKVASTYLLGETDFVKLTAQGSFFKELWKGTVLAVQVRGGVGQGFSGIKDLPLVERFFLGGRNSVRGFPQDELGPKTEDGDPKGGNAFLMGSIELRMPIWKSLGAVVFIDAGNVWRRIKGMNFQLRETAGVGIRYNTPVGPIRIDYGYKLDRERKESAGELHFSIGHAF